MLKQDFYRGVFAHLGLPFCLYIAVSKGPLVYRVLFADFVSESRHESQKTAAKWSNFVWKVTL